MQQNMSIEVRYVFLNEWRRKQKLTRFRSTALKYREDYQVYPKAIAIGKYLPWSSYIPISFYGKTILYQEKTA